jgi:thiol-disulfide isomerase/thioredoxin
MLTFSSITRLLKSQGKGMLFVYGALLIVAVVILSKYVILPFTKGEGFYSDDKKTVILYHLPGCGYCKDMMPEWDKLEKEHRNHPSVNVKKINCSEHPEEAETNGINAYPTIMLFKGGDRKVYEGERTKDAIVKFINKN